MKRKLFIAASLFIFFTISVFNPASAKAAGQRRVPSTRKSPQAASKRTVSAMALPASVRSANPASISIQPGGGPVKITLFGNNLQMIDTVRVQPDTEVSAVLEQVRKTESRSSRYITLTPSLTADNGTYSLILYENSGRRSVKKLSFNVIARQKSTRQTAMTSNVIKTRHQTKQHSTSNVKRSSSASTRTAAPGQSDSLSSQSRWVSKAPTARLRQTPRRSTQLESSQGDLGKLGQLPGTGADTGLQDPSTALDRLRGGAQGSVSGPGSMSGLTELQQRSGNLSLDRGSPGNPAKGGLPDSPGLGDSRAMAPTQQVQGSEQGTADKPEAGSPAPSGNEGAPSGGSDGSSGDASGSGSGDSSGGTSGNSGGKTTVTSSDLDTDDSDGNSTKSSTVTTESSDGSSSTHTVTEITGSDGSKTSEQYASATDKDGNTTWEYSCTGWQCNPDPEAADCVSQQCKEFMVWVEASGFARDRSLLNPRDTLINTGRDGSGTSSVTGNRPQAIDSKTVMDTKTSPYILNESSGGKEIDTPFGSEPKTTGDLVGTLPDPGQPGAGSGNKLPPGTGPDSPTSGGN